MIAERRAVAALRVFLVLLFGILVVFQVMSLPGQFAHMAEESPDMAHLRWPLTAVTVFWVLCAQVVIVSTWKLLTLVKKDRIFTESSLVWVDVIVWAIGAAWAVLLGVFLAGEQLSGLGWTALLVILTGVLLVAWPRRTTSEGPAH